MIILPVGLIQGQSSVSSTLAGTSVKVEKLEVEHTDNNLVLKMNLNLDSLDMLSNTRFVFTPLVKNDKDYMEMPQIVVNGRKQNISYHRWGYKNFKNDVVSIRRKNGRQQSFYYTAVLPYKDWMKNCNVVIAEDLCGCGGNVLNQNQVVLYKLLGCPV